MLSRIMRHPAGLMRRALGRGLFADTFRRTASPAVPPDYWADRYAGQGICLVTPAPPAPPGPAAAPAARPPEALASQGGKAASCLRPAAAAPRPEGSRARRP